MNNEMSTEEAYLSYSALPSRWWLWNSWRTWISEMRDGRGKEREKKRRRWREIESQSERKVEISMETREYTQAQVSVIQNYPFPSFIKSSLSIAGQLVDWLFSSWPFGAETLRAYHEVYYTFRPLVRGIKCSVWRSSVVKVWKEECSVKFGRRNVLLYSQRYAEWKLFCTL